MGALQAQLWEEWRQTLVFHISMTMKTYYLNAVPLINHTSRIFMKLEMKMRIYLPYHTDTSTQSDHMVSIR